MPSLKQSVGQKCTYGGINGKQLFYDAINFLFAIKGKEFAKSNPSFLTPSVDEFISFSRYSEGVVRGTVKKTQHKTHNKYQQLQHFLHFMSGGFIFENDVLRCLYITMFALATYSVTDYFLMGADTVSEEWTAAFLWYTSHTFSYHILGRDVLFGTVDRYMHIAYFDNIDILTKNYHSDETDTVAVGQYVIHSLERYNSMRSYDMLVQIPLVATWCKKTCSGGLYTPWMVDKITTYGITH